MLAETGGVFPTIVMSDQRSGLSRRGETTSLRVSSWWFVCVFVFMLGLLLRFVLGSAAAAAAAASEFCFCAEVHG